MANLDGDRAYQAAEDERDAFREEIAALRALLADAPILVINERVARMFEEGVCLEYMKQVREWHPKVKAALGNNEQNT
jgi:flagellar biosynthesis regulator FlbT